VPLMIAEYDEQGKLWKFGWNKYAPLVFHGHPFLFLDGYSAPEMVDYQNVHATFGWSTRPTIDEQVPEGYRDVSVLSSPRGLDHTLK
jgi:hypothetical protein